MRQRQKKRLGEILQETGKISAEDLGNAVSQQSEQQSGQPLGELVLERGLVSKMDLAEALHGLTDIPYLDCATVEPQPEALQKIPQPVAENCCALPVEQKGKSLIVVMAQPQNLALLGELRFVTGLEISPRMGFRQEILAAIDKHYGAGEPASEKEVAAIAAAHADTQTDEMEFVSTSARQAARDAFQEVQAELRQKTTPAVRMVSEVIYAAIEQQASDIHIEPQAGDTVIRLRVDGILRDLRRLPRGLQNSLISRIKILSDMDITERRVPQDGRFLVRLGPRKMDMRVSSLPTQYGEKIVMRLLESEAVFVSFADLGFPPKIDEQMKRLLALPQGLLLVTGPTGSGKSTTLYSALHVLRKPAVNIVTVEDPVEYVLPGINQVHVNTRAGLTFASCLRSILRQDPNVIMIGEIRDRETAEIAMKAAQTGHLVLSTLHTNDSLSAIIRLLDLEIPGYVIASALSGILAQRLIRRLCTCHTTRPATREYRARMADVGAAFPGETECVPGGCPECGETGYKGRVGIYELLMLDDSVRAAIRDGGNLGAIAAAARARGLRLMQEDALDKIRAGVTSLEEAMRVVPFEDVAGAPECPQCGRNLLPGFQFCPYCGAPRRTEDDAPRPAVAKGERVLS